MTNAPRLFEIYSDKNAMKYRQTKPHLTFEDTLEMLKRDREVRNANFEIRFGIFKTENEELIGSIMYQPIINKAIIGYSIAKETWDNGYATEVVKWLINHLKNKKYTLIEALVINENIASRKVLEKNGFKIITQTIYPNSKYYRLYIK